MKNDEKGILQLELHKTIRIISYHKDELPKEVVSKLRSRKRYIENTLRTKYNMK